MDNKIFKVSPAPHFRHEDSTKSIMSDVIIALLPALVWACYVFGLRALVIVLTSVISCVLFEFLYQKFMKKPVTVSDFSAVVTGILLAFGLPASFPLWMTVVGAFFAIVVVKQLFGGIGKNFLNPALSARVFLFSWPTEMTTYTSPFEKLPLFSNPVDIVSSATPLASLKNGVIPQISIFDLLIGNKVGCIGEISSLLLIAGGVYLLVRRVISFHIPLSFIGTVAITTYLFPLNTFKEEFMIYQLLSGGLILGAFFMATDYSTSPINNWGKVIFGVGCGLLTVFIRYFGGYPEGVSFAILIMNTLVWFIDKSTRPKAFGYIKEIKKQ